MIERTKEEIEAKIEEIWKDRDCSWRDLEKKIEIFDDRVDITLSCMYDAPGLSFKQLMALSEFFGTTAINDDDRFSYRGCESCDYGSEYGFTLTIRPEK